MPTNIVRVDDYPLAPGLARDWLAMCAAAAGDGVPLIVSSGYRTRSEQIETFTKRYTRGARSTMSPPDYRWFDGSQWGWTSGEGVVQSPDVGSNHTRGFAVDIYMGPGVFDWLSRNAARFGFNHIEGSSIGEPWHWCWHCGIFPDGTEPDPWEGRGAPDPVAHEDQGIPIADLGITPTVGGGGSAAVTIQSEEDDVKLYRVTPKGRHYAVAPGFIKQISGKESVMAYEQAVGVKEIEIDGDEFRVILGVNGIDTTGGPVVDGEGRILDERTGQDTYVAGGSWARSDKAERLAYLAQKIR